LGADPRCGADPEKKINAICSLLKKEEAPPENRGASFREMEIAGR